MHRQFISRYITKYQGLLRFIDSNTFHQEPSVSTTEDVVVKVNEVNDIGGNVTDLWWSFTCIERALMEIKNKPLDINVDD